MRGITDGACRLLAAAAAAEVLTPSAIDLREQSNNIGRFA